ncbi:hypothetical protein M408DRAFT_329773 [Serendipita vermifera MAFF 305830]|uniref:Uncharacterized protein n=1 Tax=Serendipita vermifera MAFF 305830 TaxID=933852 RepID=A0A0C3ATD9_SERVB|nr:hypothetical protein M408DRAFT_329773 [Serendipita vermifera MAFF 305830]
MRSGVLLDEPRPHGQSELDASLIPTVTIVSIAWVVGTETGQGINVTLSTKW